jgi:hypothetical protein
MENRVIYYDFKRLWRMTKLNWFKAKGTIARLTLKRILLLLFFYVAYGLLESITWFCFCLDRILFPGYLDVEIKSPVFIIGNPRSGTTFLHRLISLDSEHFRPILLWEIIFAPSIVQRKVWGSLRKIDRWLGYPVRNIVRRVEAKLFNPNKMHRIRLRMPEEDEYLMMHLGTTILGGLVFGFPEESEPFVRFDECLSQNEKEHAIAFYKRCIQRHLYYHGQKCIFISKNPFFSPKVDTLLKVFPDAFIIYLIRNPLKAVPSFASLSAFWWHIFCDTKVDYPYPEFIMETMRYWYRYPLQRLEKEPTSRYMVMRFEDMVSNPRKAVESICECVGVEITPAYTRILDEETEKSRQYKSTHKYSLEVIGYTREQIIHEFSDVFHKWQFDIDA